MYFDITNTITMEQLLEKMESINKKMDWILEGDIGKYTNSIPEACRNCPTHPSNGGSGICNCILGLPKITC